MKAAALYATPGAVRKPRRRDEEALQIAVVAYLRAVAPDHLTFAVPNGARRSVVEGASMKRSGTVAGVPDLVIVAPLGKAHFLELKTAKGKLSQAQASLRIRMTLMGIPHAVCRSLDDVRVALEAWKIQTREATP